MREPLHLLKQATRSRKVSKFRRFLHISLELVKLAVVIAIGYICWVMLYG